MESKHAPGPWSVQALEESRHEYEGWNTFAVRDARNICVATVGEVDRAMSDSAYASARLIAAAPELLDVCKGALGYLRALPESHRPDAAWLAPLEDAIAKAEGREP